MKERNKSVRKLLRLIIMVVLLSVPISISVLADTYVSESEPNDRRVDANEILFPDAKETIIVNGNIESGTVINPRNDFFKLVIPKDCVLDFKIEYSADSGNGNLYKNLWAGLCSEKDAQKLDNFVHPISGTEAKGEYIYILYTSRNLLLCSTSVNLFTYIHDDF